MAHFCKKLQADCRRGWMLALTAMLIVFAPAAFAQSAPTVTGTVTDQSGQPVIGATIIEQGTTNGATTGVDGSYSLKLRGGGNSANLIFQSLGFVSQTVAVNGRTKIDVKLAEDAVALDAVVAIGYGTVKQKDLTTAVSVVKTDDLARRPITSASGALQGKAAGVQVIQPNGSPGQGMVVRVRGASSISSSNDPLYVVDGVPVGEGNYADRGIPGYTADTSYPEDDTSVLVRSTEAAAAGADIYWDAAKNLKGATNHNMNDWIAYFTDANGLGEDSLSDVIVYSGGNALNGGHDDAQGSLSDWESNNARYRTWKWYNEDDIPVMTYIFSLYEAHNCIPGFRPLMWDFLEHYSVETAADGTVTRYYSASGFEQDDAVVIQ